MKRQKEAILGLLVAFGGCTHVQTTVPRYHFEYSVLNYDKSELQPRSFNVPAPIARQSSPRGPDSQPSGVAAGASVSQMGSANVFSSSNVSAIGVNQTRRPARVPEVAMPITRVHPVQVDTETVPRAENSRTDHSDAIHNEEPGGVAITVDNDSSDGKLNHRGNEKTTDRPDGNTAADLSAPSADGAAHSPMPFKPSLDRQELVNAASRLIGIRNDFTSDSFIRHVLTVTNQGSLVAGSGDWLKDLYKDLRSRGKTYDRQNPREGDLVFFHNTDDRNNDSRNNDWYSLCGVVKSVDPNGIVTFIAYANGQVQELVMSLGRPEVRRDETAGVTLNSVLRSKRLSDPEYTQYLAGELFAGFASLD